MVHDPKFWLAISFLIFTVAIVKYVMPSIIKMIDDKAAGVANNVMAASEARDKAEQLLVATKKYYQDSIAHATKLISDAEIEAANLIASSQKMIQEELDRKMELTTKRIRQEEERAMREIKAWLISSAVGAIKENVTKINDRKLSDLILKKSINDAGNLIN